MKRKLFSLSFLILFFLSSVNSQSISEFEYFVDVDPGVGSGTSFIPVISDSVTVNIPINTTGIPVGYHTLGVRSVDVNGVWSHAEFRTFYINSLPDNSNQQLVLAEFYLGETDPGVGSAFPFSIINPADSVSIIADTVLNNLPIGQYKINIRFKDARGIWSHQETRLFNVCSTYGAQSDFNYQVEGNKVFFTNNSLYYDTISWRFGDNTVDTVNNPIKTYTNAGVYNVQLITGNNCGIDTLTTAIEIRGLQRVNANKAGNGGVSTLIFEGFGFTNSTNVKLIFGAQVINPVSKQFLNANRIRANFDFTGLTPDLYKAVATLGGAFDTLNNAVLIETTKAANITLITPEGRRLVRTGRVNVYGTIMNNGNQDAIMVPYINVTNVIPGIATVNMNPFVYTDLVPLLNEGIFEGTYQYLSGNNVPPEVMFAYNLDSARNRQTIAYYKTRVAGESSTMERVGLPHSTTNSYSFQTGAIVLGPLLDSYALLDSINTDYEPCYSSFLKQGVEKQLNIQVNDASWSVCFTQAFDTLMRTLVNISQNPVYDNFSVPMQACFSALLSRMAQCGGSGVPANLGGLTFKRIIQDVMNNWIYLEDIDSLDADCIDTTKKVFSRSMNDNLSPSNNRIESGGDCSDCPGAQVFPEMCDQCLPILQAGKIGGKLKVKGHAWAANSAVKGCQEWCETTSIDPNAKYGPGNNTDRKYINHLKEVNYNITFENLPSASSPAAFVEIRDTIDKSVFDIHTLRLNVFSWGDSVITAEPNEQNVSILKNLKPVHPNFLRIDATTDTALGIVRWRFWTVDTVTLQLTTDPAEGFLPPNTDGVSGAGYVSFSIAPKTSITNGTILKNKASIIFDDNTPIITNEWEYRIDTLKPSSAVNNLPVTTPTPSFTVSWSGTDAHAGVDLYSVYVSINDSTYKVWQSLTDLTSATYTGQFGNTYKFFSIALDKAGNFEDPPLDVLNNPDAVTTLQSPLPLNLLSFTAAKTMDGKKVDLYWQTGQEQNVSHFELQRSADGINYTVIGNVQAQNNPIGATYSWRDINPLSKINYYRLKIIDLDTSYKYSPVRIVHFTQKDEVLVFPTLTKDLVFVQSGKQMTAELFNVQGTKLQTQVINLNAIFDMSRYPAGIYYIRVLPGNKTYKIVKW